MGRTEEKGERRERRRVERRSETRSLEPWERYRALNDALRHLRDVSDMGDQKSRFALIIMGALNAVNYIVLVRSDLNSASPSFALVVYAAVYAVAALYLFIQAIESLRPRAPMESTADDLSGRPMRLAGVRTIGNILDISTDTYDERWRGVPIGELCREIALHVQIVARVNASKFKAIARLYRGLEIQTFLTAGLLAYRVLTA